MDAWEEQLRPLVRAWVDGEAVDDEVRAAAVELTTSRDRLQALINELRTEVRFVPKLSESMRALFAAVERCDRAEVDEVIPALSGDREAADRVERSQTPEGVARGLREAAKRPPEPKPVVAKDPLMQLLGWFGLTRKSGDQRS
jgi:hypothetical protein